MVCVAKNLQEIPGERADLGLGCPRVVRGSCPDKIHGTVVQTFNRNSIPDLAVPNGQRLRREH
jgi:hypothetical protein